MKSKITQPLAKSLIVILICFTLLANESIQSITSSKENNSAIQLDSPQLLNFKTTANQPNYFSFEHKYIEKESLSFLSILVLTNQTDFDSDPNLYVSTIHHRPDKFHHEYKSEKAGSDLILIRSPSLGGLFNIGVHCNSDCTYEIKAEVIYQDTSLEPGKIKNSLLQKGEVRVYHTKGENSILENIRFYSYSLTGANQIFNIVSSLDTSAYTSSEQGLKAQSSWNGGYEVSIEPSSRDYCPDCNYLMLLSCLSPSCVLYHGVEYSQVSTFLEPGQGYFTSLRSSNTHCFVQRLEARSQVLLSMVFWIGKGYVHINPGSMPLVLEDSKLVYRVEESWEFDWEAPQGDVYYCFKASVDSHFYIKGDVLPLSLGSQEWNFLFKNTTVNVFVRSLDERIYRFLEFTSLVNLNVTGIRQNGNAELFGVRIKANETRSDSNEIIPFINKSDLAYHTLDIENLNPQEFRLLVKCKDQNQNCNLKISINYTPIEKHLIGFSSLLEKTPLGTRTIAYHDYTKLSSASQILSKVSFSIQSQRNCSIAVQNEWPITLPIQNGLEATIKKDILRDQQLERIFKITISCPAFTEFLLKGVYTLSDRKEFLPKDFTSLKKGEQLGVELYGEDYKILTIDLYYLTDGFVVNLSAVFGSLGLHVVEDINLVNYANGSILNDLCSYRFVGGSFQECYLDKELIGSRYIYVIVLLADRNKDCGDTCYKDYMSNGENLSTLKGLFYIGLATLDNPLRLYDSSILKSRLDSKAASFSILYNPTEPNQSIFLQFYIPIGSIDYSIKETSIKGTVDEKSSTVEIPNQSHEFTKGIQIVLDSQHAFFSLSLFQGRKKPILAEADTIGKFIGGSESRHYALLDKESTISVNFYDSVGEFFVSVMSMYDIEGVMNRLDRFNIHDVIPDVQFPNLNYYFKRSKNDYRKETVLISKKDISNCMGLCVVLLNVVFDSITNHLDHLEEDLTGVYQYDLTIVSKALELRHDSPYVSRLKEGTSDLFTFKTLDYQAVHVTLLSFNGDADLYISQGSTEPTLTKYDYKSAGLSDDYINLPGNSMYTIKVHSYISTSYVIYLSQYTQKVLPLVEDASTDCIVEKYGECLFVYYHNDWSPLEEGLSELEVLVYIDYQYGSGELEGRLLGDEANQTFKTEGSLLNAVYKQLDRASKTFKLSFKYKAYEASYVKVHLSRKAKKGEIRHLDANRQHVFYIDTGSFVESLFVFNNHHLESLNLRIDHLEDSFALVKVYSKSKIYGVKNFREFVLAKEPNAVADSTMMEISQRYHINGLEILSSINLLIENTQIDENVYILLTTIKNGIGLKINISYPDRFKQLELNNEQKYKTKGNRSILAYIPILSLYEKVYISIKAAQSLSDISAFVIYKKQSKSNPFNPDLPSNSNKHIVGISDSHSGISLVIPSLESTDLVYAFVAIDIHGKLDSDGLEEISVFAFPSIKKTALLRSLPKGYGIEKVNFLHERLLVELDVQAGDRLVFEMSDCNGLNGFVVDSLERYPEALDEKTLMNIESSYDSIHRLSGRSIVSIRAERDERLYITAYSKLLDSSLLELNSCKATYPHGDRIALEDCLYSKSSRFEFVYYTGSNGFPNEAIDSNISISSQSSKSIQIKWHAYSSNASYSIYTSNQQEDMTFIESVCFLRGLKLVHRTNKTFAEIQIPRSWDIIVLNILAENESGGLKAYKGVQIARDWGYTFIWFVVPSVSALIVFLLVIALIVFKSKGENTERVKYEEACQTTKSIK